MSKRKETTGFTLIELLVVVAIVAILGAIAYPSYQEHVRKARRAEGKQLLLDTAQALVKCKSLYGAYNNANCKIVGAITGDNELTSAKGFYRVSASAGPAAATFTLQAVPQQPDPKCETLTIDQTGAKTESGADTLDYCW